jgi:hypothetical protein
VRFVCEPHTHRTQAAHSHLVEMVPVKGTSSLFGSTTDSGVPFFSTCMGTMQRDSTGCRLPQACGSKDVAMQ